MNINRRQFLRRFLYASAALGFTGVGYPLAEAKWCRVTRITIAVPNLPDAFDGTTIALLADIHHGSFVPLWYVQHVVDMTNELYPDIVCLCGDYVHRHEKYIDPCIDQLGRLEAPLGVYAVLGNHDHWENASATRAALRKNRIPDLTNEGVWLKKQERWHQEKERLRLCGVGDLWEDVQRLDKALGDAGNGDAVILLSHNPDYVEQISDSRVGLVLSGHTHGGQVELPFVGAPFVPSRFGEKYLRGLVRTPSTQVYVSRGVGTITPPVRFRCRPEIVLIDLA